MNDINATSFAQEARTETSAGRAADYNSGIDTARGLLNRPDNFSPGLGGGDSATRDAIRSKYAGEFGRKMERLSFDNVKNANSDHLKKLEVATAMAGEEYQMNMQKEMMRKKQAQMKQAMRAQLVGSVLGIVGGAAGGAMGGPTGAMGGMAAGQGIGTVAAGGFGEGG